MLSGPLPRVVVVLLKKTAKKKRVMVVPWLALGMASKPIFSTAFLNPEAGRLVV